MVIWFTGQPGSGKTTLATSFIENVLYSHYYLKGKIIHIDGDDIRKTLARTDAEDYSRDGRFKNIQWAVDTSVFLVSKGFLPVVSMVSPYRWMREQLKTIGRGAHYSKLQPRFKVLEVYCHSERPTKREKYWVDDYQQPLNEFIDMDTTNKSIEECVDEILDVYRQMANMARRP
tara:strand:+ start:70 stop:591 length:522 start_codon:yes stop_codon:yes gene_type:complete